ncbi:MAG: RES family NAD+ phosphorylase [Bradyrhizobiaceae bacterium]|nr:RES family NAD+ phosphorylase [Bradyrhizobiaceae bacterium]
MSSSTWTLDALPSDARDLNGTCWRLVEAQHHVSTLKLVDSVDEQELLEDLIEASKPPLPPECRDLHYLLSTPFRYGAVYPAGSRFRRAGMTEGVFYASEVPHTAVAEMAFYRLLFFAESPDTPWPANPAEYTAFSAEYSTNKAIDLTKGKYRSNRARWMHVTDYSHCQAFADAARTAKIEIIRYASVRDPAHGMNLALLSCRAFAQIQPVDQQTWHIRLSEAGAQAVCEAPKSGITFDRRAFAADPRIAKLRWIRA